MKSSKLTLPESFKNPVQLLDGLKKTITQFLQTRPYDFLLGIAVLTYGIIFSYFTILKHYGFSSYAWDLGTFDQAFYTTLFHGKLFYYTPELLFNTSGSYFAVHFSPILFFFLPFYLIHPSAITLLILKAFILALGALPLYILAKESLKNEKGALILAITYLVYPPLQGANWFDFQPQVLLPLLFFSSSYFMLKKRWKLYFITTLLALMVEEHIAFIVLITAAYYLFTSRPWHIHKSIKHLQMNKHLVLLVTIGLSMIWFLAAKGVIGLFPIESAFLEEYKAINNWEILGIEGDPLAMPLHALLHPQLAFQALLYDYPVKFLYIVLLFGPLLFLPFRSKISIIVFILLAPFLLSNFRAYYTIGCHYPLYIIPLIFLAIIEVLSRKGHLRDLTPTLKNMTVVSIIFIVSTSPISPFATPFIDDAFFWYPSLRPLDERVESLHELIGLIPPNASILTQNHVFPHVSNRLKAYVIPIARWTSSMNAPVINYLKRLIDESEYILLDLGHRGNSTLFVFDEVTENEQYGAYAFAGKTVLFKRDFAGTPMIVPNINYEVFLAKRDLTIDFGKVVPDPSSKSDYVVLCPKGTHEGSIYGPYVYLPPGKYEAIFEIKVGEPNEGYIGTFDVADNHSETVLSKRDLYGFELEPDKWNNITLPFSSTKNRHAIEFRLFTSGAVDVYIDRIIVNRITPEATVDFGMHTFNFNKLVLGSGYISDEGFLTHRHNMPGGFFWYGPYVSLPQGRYRVTFFLKTSPIPQEAEHQIVALDITSNNGDTLILPSRDVYASSFLDTETISGWYNYTLEFTGDHLEYVEFRALNPSSYYDIYLSFILLEKVD